MYAQVPPALRYSRKGLSVIRTEHKTPPQRIAGWRVGPALNADPIIWDPKSTDSVEQALVRNLDEPAEASVGLDDIIKDFHRAIVSTGVDAMGVKPCLAVAEDYSYFVAAAKLRSRMKYLSYLEALVCLTYVTMFDYFSAVVQRASFFVKTEVMAPGKMPRAIIDVPKWEVLAVRPYDHIVEEFTMRHASVKGLSNGDRARVLDVARDRLGCSRILGMSIDDTSRDKNVNMSNKRGYVSLLHMLCVHVCTAAVMLYTRCRVVYRAEGIVLIGQLVNLASGASYTSSLNWYVSLLMMWYICELAGVGILDRILSGEGDDSLILVVDTVENRWRLSQVDLTAVGRALGKCLKLEAFGSLNDGVMPFVGGYFSIVYDHAVFLPSYKRGWMKAGVIPRFGTDAWPARNVYALCKSKAVSVCDKYSGIPVYYAYARKLSELYGLWNFVSEPDLISRIVYERAGVSMSKQLFLESCILNSTIDPADF